MSHEQCTTSARHSTCDTDIFPVPFAVSGISLRVLVLNEQSQLVEGAWKVEIFRHVWMTRISTVCSIWWRGAVFIFCGIDEDEY